MRTRSRVTGGGQSLGYSRGKSWYNTVDIQNFTESYITTPYNLPWTQDTISDVVTTNFRKKSANGDIINNPMSIVRISETPPQATTCIRDDLRFSNNRYSGSRWSGSWPVPMSVLGDRLPILSNATWAANVSSLQSKAVLDAHSRASATDVSMPTMVAEGQKTIASVTSILTRALRVGRAARRLDLRYLRRQLRWKELQDRYMELRYAVRPMVYDLKGIIAAVEHSKRYTTTRSTSRGFGSTSHEISDVITKYDNGVTFTVGRSGKVQTTIRAGVLSDITLGLTNSLGIDQPLQTAWELVPLSFVLDWFFDVGGTIAAWSPKQGVTQRASWVVVEHLATYRNAVVSCANSTPANYMGGLTWSGSYQREEYYKTRTPNPSLNVIPSLNVKLDPFKLLDLAIIGKQLVKRLLH